MMVSMLLDLVLLSHEMFVARIALSVLMFRIMGLFCLALLMGLIDGGCNDLNQGLRLIGAMCPGRKNVFNRAKSFLSLVSTSRLVGRSSILLNDTC